MMKAQQSNQNFKNEQEYNEYIQKTFNIDDSKMKKSKIKKKKKKKRKKVRKIKNKYYI